MTSILGDETPDAEVYYSPILIATNAVTVAELPSYDLFELYDEFHETCLSLRESRYITLTARIDSRGDEHISRVRHIKRLTQMLTRLVIHAERLMLLHIPETDAAEDVADAAAVYAILLSGTTATTDISDAIPSFAGTPGTTTPVAYLNPDSVSATTYRSFLSDFHEVKRETLDLLGNTVATSGTRDQLADELWRTWALIFHIANEMVTSETMVLSPSLKTCRGRICRAVAVFRMRLAAYVAYISGE